MTVHVHTYSNVYITIYYILFFTYITIYDTIPILHLYTGKPLIEELLESPVIRDVGVTREEALGTS